MESVEAVEAQSAKSLPGSSVQRTTELWSLGGNEKVKMILLLCVLLVPIAPWAGTFKDDFSDDNLAGTNLFRVVV